MLIFLIALFVYVFGFVVYLAVDKVWFDSTDKPMLGLLWPLFAVTLGAWLTGLMVWLWLVDLLIVIKRHTDKKPPTPAPRPVASPGNYDPGAWKGRTND